MSTTYDLREARELIGIAAGVLPTAQAAREAAHLQLAEALLELNGIDGLQVYVAPENKKQVCFKLGRNEARLSWNPSGGHSLFVPGREPLALPFHFNADSKKFQALTSNEYLVPMPGEPRGARDTTAVIIEVMLKLWGGYR